MLSDYTPAAVADCVVSAAWGAEGISCPECGTVCRSLYRMMGTSDAALCGRCFDDKRFEGKPELRAECEARRDLIVARVLGALPSFLADHPC